MWHLMSAAIAKHSPAPIAGPRIAATTGTGSHLRHRYDYGDEHRGTTPGRTRIEQVYNLLQLEQDVGAHLVCCRIMLDYRES